MKTLSKSMAILFISAITISSFSCRETNEESTEEHGHEHDADGGHMENAEEHGHEHIDEGGHQQEEFEVGNDTTTHTHDDGEEHTDH